MSSALLSTSPPVAAAAGSAWVFGFERLEVLRLDRGADRDRVFDEGHAVALFELPAHQAAARRRPGAVLDQRHLAVRNVVRDEIGNQRFHRDEDARVIRCGGKDEVAPAEGRRDDLRRRRHRNVEHHGLDPAVTQAAGEDLGRHRRVAVHRSVRDHDAVLLRLIAAPEQVLSDEIADVAPPDEAVQRADHLDVEPGRLRQQRLHLRAVLADDIRVVAARLVKVIALKIDLVGENRAVQRAEAAERVCGKQDLVGQVVRHHDLRPVHHRRHDEGQLVAAGFQHVALRDDMGVRLDVEREELLDHRDDLRVTDNLHLRVARDELLQRGGMVGLHMVHDDVIERAAAERMLDVLEEHAAHGLVDRIEQDGLFIQQKIGVVGNALRDAVDALKHREPAVVCADPDQVLPNFFSTIHCSHQSFFQNPNPRQTADPAAAGAGAVTGFPVVHIRRGGLLLYPL